MAIFKCFSSALMTILIYVIGSVHSRNLPDYVNVCKWDTENMSDCYRDAVLHLRPYLEKGIPEMGLPSIEPLVVQEVQLNNGEGASVSLNATLNNLVLSGGSKYELRKFDVDIKQGRWYMEIFFPLIKMQSNYKAKAKVLLLQFQGEGKAHGEFGGVLLSGNITAKPVEKNGKTHFKADGQTTKVDVETIKFHLDDLFSGNPLLTENLNKVIDENANVLAEDVKPVIAETLSTLFLRYINGVNDRFPIDVLYPKN